MYIYLIMSVICENGIDALRSYSAKKTQNMFNSIYLIVYRIHHCMKTTNTAIMFVFFTEILLPHVFHHVSWS